MTESKMIRIRMTTYERLQEVGTFGESANDLLNRLIDFYEKHGGD